MRPCWTCLFAVVATAIVSAGVAAQAAPRREAPAGFTEAAHADRLLVKLAEGSGAVLRNGVLQSDVGADLEAIDRLFQRAAAEPLVTAVSRAELDRLHRHAAEVLPPGRRPGHMGLWFRLRAPSAAVASALLVELAETPGIEHVYCEPKYALAGSARLPDDIPPVTPLYTAMQYAQDPAPLGHGVRAVHGILGARGRDIGLRMLETSWIFDHEDVSQLITANVIGAVPALSMNDANHGLAGTSIVLADRNAYGITGIADEMQPRFLAIPLSGGLENSILAAAASSQPGDVILVVLMVLVPSMGPGSWLPFEFYQAAFDATLTATANDRSVVVPAGNGDRSLDDPALLNRFDRSFRDSGAIIVGASAGGLLQRAAYSNWGSRIDANSWGDQVVSCGYGTLFYPNNDMHQAYTAGYTGTSSATPHLAGLVGVIQGAARKQLGHVLSNAQILTLLHTYGTPTPDVIGLRPDLLAVLQALGCFDGLAVGSAQVPLGGTIAFAMDGPVGSAMALFGSLDTGDVDLGLNRRVHIDVSTMASVGAYFLPGGVATGSLSVPATASLQGVHIYFQAARLLTTGPLHLTNSCHVTIL